MKQKIVERHILILSGTLLIPMISSISSMLAKSSENRFQLDNFNIFLLLIFQVALMGAAVLSAIWIHNHYNKNDKTRNDERVFGLNYKFITFTYVALIFLEIIVFTILSIRHIFISNKKIKISKRNLRDITNIITYQPDKLYKFVPV